MDADGSERTQLTRNAAHDEGPAWSPNGRMLAYTSGPDDEHGDVYVITAAGRLVRRLPFFAGLDESPDWRAVRVPRSARRCGDEVEVGRGAHDVRAKGAGLGCRESSTLARRWAAAGRPRRISGIAAQVIDFGGTRRVVLSRRTDGRRRVAFLYQASGRRGPRPAHPPRPRG